MATRLSTSDCMATSKKRSVLRPAALAWYMARSACLSKSSTLCTASPISVMPILGELRCSRPANWYGAFKELKIFLPILSACAAASSASPSRSSSTTTNSSPPSRATVSDSRTQVLRRSATCCSSKSPTSWPRVSLRVLKLSRSMNSKAPRMR